MKHPRFLTLAAAMAMFLSGCAGPAREETFAPRPPARDVLRAEALFNNGQVRDAIFACVDIARKNPDTAGLAELQAKIQRYLAAHRTASFETVNNTTHAVGMSDVRKYQSIPTTFNQRRHVRGETDSLKAEPTPMQRVLNTPAEVELVDADLNAIIAEIGRSQNINIIADAGLTDATVTVKMSGVPYIELLEYIGRNMGVSFHVGENMIWVTAADPDADAGAPLETRVYRLRKGLVGLEMPPSQPTAGFSAGSGGAGGGGAGSAEPSTPKLIEMLERFVAQPAGADMMWDDKVHALFLKNTRENLRLSEDIIDAMDVAPIQISIAARFMTVKQTDIRELGIDWLLSNQKGDYPWGGAGAGFWPRAERYGADGSASPRLASGAVGSTVNSSGLDLLFQAILGRNAVQAVFRALEESGKSQMLAQPRLTTLNNTEAHFRKGEDFRFFEDFDLQNYSSSAGGYGNGSSSSGTSLVPTGSPTVEELGYILRVTPSVGADLASINLRLRTEISSFDGEWVIYDLGGTGGTDADGNPVAGNGTMKLPNFLRSFIETQVNVRSGETIILGGMIDTIQSTRVRGVPVLSSLPLIGRFFRTEEKENKPSNLLIFVTATIISDTGEELISINPQILPGLPVPPEYGQDETDDGADEFTFVPAGPYNPVPREQDASATLP